MNLDKLKESARKYEQSGQWRPAIDVYKKALREFEESGEGVPDPSLYNRIGDLEMKDGESNAAIRAYEQASDLYTEQGFFNNAIALCGKILRINPARTSTYLRLAQLNARKNFVGEARKSLVEYIERMDAARHREEALAAMRAFADQFSGNPDIRDMLVDMLRAGPASREHLAKFAEELDERGDAQGAQRAREQLRALDDHTGGGRGHAGDLIFIDLGPNGQSMADRLSVPGLEFDRPDPAAEESWRRDTSRVEGIELDPTSDTSLDAMPEILIASEVERTSDDIGPLDADSYPAVAGERSMDGMDLIDSELDPDARDANPEAGVAETYETLDEAVRAEPVSDDAPPARSGSDLVFLAVEQDSDGAPTARDAVEADELATSAWDRGRLLLEIGDRSGGIAALDAALERYEAAGRVDEALDVATDLTRAEPEMIYRFQKRVELAYRCGRREALLNAYLALAEALLRGGGSEHALTVYKRVVEHDPSNVTARLAIESLAKVEAPPPPKPEPPKESFIDLGSLILDEPLTRDTRIRVDQAAPIEDEEQAFHEALTQFKRGIEENIDAEDFQAHYDLGIAFKEMGLLDEAIAQFQRALRAPEGRLKTSEQLGIAFFEKARFAIAEAVLRRAIESLPGGDEDKIGLIYWLGRSVEMQRRHEESVRCYERVLAVDIRFLDVGDRVHRLTTESP